MHRRTTLVTRIGSALTAVVLGSVLPGGPARAAVDDPAGTATPYHAEFALFRSANMTSPDKLASGIGFHSFRIPSVVRTATGRMLAFAEGRRSSSLDYGDINLVYKRTRTTTGGGATTSDWEPLQEVVGGGNGTWGNPTAVVDGSTIYLFMSWNAGDRSQYGLPLADGTPTKKVDSTEAGRRRLYLVTSTDDGASWSDRTDMTSQLTPSGKDWDAVGPGVGIRMSSGELVVPADGRNLIGRGTPGNRTWSYQALPGIDSEDPGDKGGGSEGTVLETPDGKLYRNDRLRKDNYGKYRWVSRGTLDGFGAFAADTGLPDPGCQGSTLRYNGDAPARSIFLNSASTSSRTEMRVRISYDADARRWTYGRKLSDAPISGAGHEGGYSSMAKTPDFKIGALVETDFRDGAGSASHRAIVWRRFNLSWILHGPNN